MWFLYFQLLTSSFRILCLLVVRWFFFVMCYPTTLMMMYKLSLHTWSKVGKEGSIKFLVVLVVGSDMENLIHDVPFFVK